MIGRAAFAGTIVLGLALTARAADPAAVERGRQALLGRAFSPPVWSTAAFENVWRQWPGADGTRPADYAAAFAERYGLPPAPYPNGGLPMGLRESRNLLLKGVTNDCLLCHGGAVAGHSYVGLGNASLDMQTLYEDMAVADGRSARTPFPFSNVRGTTEAGAMAVFLMALREPDLQMRSTPLDLGLRADLCEKAPAWWLLKKKKTMYHTGSSDARSVRSLMQFMIGPLTTPSALKKEEATFRDIQAYLLSLTPPRYPFPVDTERAHRGEAVFRATCARCHGTYGPDGSYPNKVVSIDVVNTDRTRYEGFTDRAGRHYNRSWFAHEKTGWLADDYPARPALGYQAPPLDGVWATAPYFHNRSVPSVYHVLNSGARPKYFTRSYRTDSDAYDPVKLGWNVKVLAHGAGPGLAGPEQRKIYDTTLPGRGNGGHTFGDDLSDDERMAVIEYLKTL